MHNLHLSELKTSIHKSYFVYLGLPGFEGTSDRYPCQSLHDVRTGAALPEETGS